MTLEGIAKRAAREASIYEAARQIRLILDQTREAYGPDAYDDGEVEASIIELVTEDDELA